MDVTRPRPAQHEISAWAVATFGDGGSDLRVAARMNEEAAELLTAATVGAGPAELAEECADVFICAARLASRLAYDLDAELELRPRMPRTGADADGVAGIAVVAAGLSTQVALALVVTSGARRQRVGQLLGGLATQLRELCDAVGVNFDDAVAGKMAKNRARRWVLDGTGCGRHTETT